MPKGFEENVSEDLKESRENIIVSQRKGKPSYVMVESLATLSLIVIWKIRNVSINLMLCLKKFPNRVLEISLDFQLALVKSKWREMS